MTAQFGWWAWPTVGLLLIALEMLVIPGGFLLWLGIAALLMGGVSWLFPMGWPMELVVFGILAIGACLIAWKLHHGKARESDSADGLHDRGGALIGRIFELDQAINDGIGRVRIDDTVWRVSGADAPAGAKVRVAGVDGATLKVVPG